MRTHMCVCVRRLRVSLAFIFQKQIYLLIKNNIFHFNISQVNLEFDWALNQPWALEFQHHWGMGAWVVKGTKCNVYSIWLKTLLVPIVYLKETNSTRLSSTKSLLVVNESLSNPMIIVFKSGQFKEPKIERFKIFKVESMSNRDDIIIN